MKKFTITCIVIIVLIVSGFLLGLLIQASYLNNQLNIEIQNPEEVDAIIQEIYRTKDEKSSEYKYFIEVETPDCRHYTIEISKSRFMKYIVDDIITIRIKNNTVTIIED